jgi:two-component system chemotaxis sensor kinase CheA
MSIEPDPVPAELLNDFYAEAHLQLAALEKNVLALEAEPERRELLNEIFRAAHNLKGASGAVKMSEIETLTHLLEDVLTAVRAQSVAVNRELVDLLLEALDVLRSRVEARSGCGSSADESSLALLRQRLRALIPAEVDAEKDASTVSSALPEPGKAALPDKPGYRLAVTFCPDNPMQSVGGVQVYTILKRTGRVVHTDPDLEALCGDTFFEKVVYTVETDLPESRLRDLCTIPDVTSSCEISRYQPDSSESREAGWVSSTADAAPELRSGGDASHQPPLRVDSRRIDDLLELANEAVAVKTALNRLNSQFEDTLESLRSAEANYRQTLRKLNQALPGYVEQIRRNGSTSELREQIRLQFDRMVDGFHAFQQNLGEKNGRFRNAAKDLDRITGKLQESILRVRMVPLSRLFSRFPRLVRDLTRLVEKKAELIISGENTEVDRSILEDIQDPLVHCVRNAVDHGIETPGERIKGGKEPVGKIVLDARIEEGEVVLTVEDDGQGIDLRRVRTKAIERGLIGAEAYPSAEDLFEIIFAPGFSTADAVTRISGRGVGLDVIRRQVEELNGNVRLWSEAGKGTRFTLRIPLRLSVVKTLLARWGNTIFAVPAAGVVESITLSKTELAAEPHGAGVYYRGEKLPLLRPVSPFKVDAAECRAYNYVIILQAAEKRAALLVDSLLGEENIAVRLSEDSGSVVAAAAGSARLADGTTALVLGIRNLLDCAESQI